MSTQQLEALEIKELETLRLQVDEIIGKKRTAQRKEVLNQIREIAEGAGLSQAELAAALSGKKRRTGGPKAGSKVAPKYRNPKDVAQTWTGRGKQPVWLREAIEGGANKEDFLIA